MTHETAGDPVSGLKWTHRTTAKQRLAALRELLVRRSETSALMLRRLLGRMVLEPVDPGPGNP